MQLREQEVQDARNLARREIACTPTIVDVLLSRAEQEPLATIYEWFDEEGTLKEMLTFGRLDREARAVAALLQASVAEGARALLICGPGLDCIVGFWACLYAGVIAVPVPPISHKGRDLRLKAIAADAGVSLVLGAMGPHKAAFLGQFDLPLLALERSSADASMAEDWKLPVFTINTVAFLQYTSGSTGMPKGVMVTHENLQSNAAHMESAFALSGADQGVFWLPLFHDMGLMGGVIQPVYTGYPTSFLSPATLMSSPLSWLKLIDQKRATVSGGPNFSFHLCVHAAERTGAPQLDISSWRVAFNGAEMVRAETVERFARTFESNGFRAAAFKPCYGLAEATLLVTAAQEPAALHACQDSPPAGMSSMGTLRVCPATTPRSRRLMSVGCAASGVNVCIVNQESRTPCEEGEIGEVWVAGPGVAKGYWNRPEETVTTFKAHVAGTSAPAYLRTGDLGAKVDGHLYITGRIKDLIVIRGRNYYPSDLESSIDGISGALRIGHSAIFSVEEAGEERLVVVQELSRAGLKADHASAIARIREAIFDCHEIHASVVLLIRTGTLQKTSSGKVQRGFCRSAYLEGALQVIATSSADSAEFAQRGSTPIMVELIRLLAKTLGCSEAEINPSTPLATVGLDSLMALHLKLAIEEKAGLILPLSYLLTDATVGDLQEQLAGAAARAAPTPGLPETELGTARSSTLSTGQKALWFLQQLDLLNTSLHITRLLRVEGEMDPERLRAALVSLVERHPMLRARVRVEDGEPMLEHADPADICLDVHRAFGWTQQALDEHQFRSVRVPFNLGQEPMLRFDLYQHAGEASSLLVAAHHIAVDLWSFEILIRDLASIYTGLTQGTEPQLGPPGLPYRAFVEHQKEILSSPTATELRTFWQARLADLPSPLDLTIGRRQKATGKSGAVRFELTRELTEGLKQLARSQRATPYAVVLAAFEVLLYRYSGKDDFLLGVLSTGREHAGWSKTVGYFVNPVVIRPRLAGSSTFLNHLASTRNELLAALDHAAYPFASLVEGMQSAGTARGVPLLQVMCMLQPSADDPNLDLGGFAIGCEGSSFHLGDLKVHSTGASAQDAQDAQFELVLSCAEVGGAIHLALQHDTGLFTTEAIAGLATDLSTLLAGVVAAPDDMLDCLPLLDPARMGQATLGLRGTTHAVPLQACIHELFEQQVARTPASIAVVCGEAHLTYEELDLHADQLAFRLLNLGVRPEARVALFLDRSPLMLVALLGVLKAGAAYVPLDPAHPAERREQVLESANVSAVITAGPLHRTFGERIGVEIICLDLALPLRKFEAPSKRAKVDSAHLAYVMYTSGSTGKPKGVMISHRSVTNFFTGMDEKFGAGPQDTLLAVTGVAFDISVLELLWTLTRGCRIILAPDSTAFTPRLPARSPLTNLSFSLFYFAGTDEEPDAERYGLLLEGAKLADKLGFEAVWTPERHFHPFGGLYPNPSITSAALSTITSRIKLRAGSVVMPLQHPVRVAEEWAMVDRLSGGRVGLAFASGWHSDDFVFFPEHYETRRKVSLDGMETVRKLWRGEKVKATNGLDREVSITTYPRPLQAELPVWLTSGGTSETFIEAGRRGTNVLTHLLGQQWDDIRTNTRLYRDAYEATGREQATATVTLMLHTYLDESLARVEQVALGPFKRYLDSSIGLVATLVRSLKLDVDVDSMTRKDRADLLDFATSRYLKSSGLFGTEASCLDSLEAAADAGVKEIACLVDFGIERSLVLRSIERVHTLAERLSRRAQPLMAPEPTAALALRYGVTLLQCTPSFLRIAQQDPRMSAAVSSLRWLMIGGEPVPAYLARQAAEQGARVANMYGPTETTIWSSVLALSPGPDEVRIGGPIVNTQLHLLDRGFQYSAPGTVGEIFIGGDGLARGYLDQPSLTAQRFLPDPFSAVPGARMYATGDLARNCGTGHLELLGRADTQVKLRGHRIELGDIETHLNVAPGVQTAVVIKQGDGDANERLTAFLVPSTPATLDLAAVQAFARSTVPSYMVPGEWHVVKTLPLNANGKVDRGLLRVPAEAVTASRQFGAVAPRAGLEAQIAALWKEALAVESVSLEDNFFDLGGHSLLLVQVHHRLQTLIGREFPLLVMLEKPKLRDLAQHLEGIHAPVMDQSVDQALRQRSALERQWSRSTVLADGRGDQR